MALLVERCVQAIMRSHFSMPRVAELPARDLDEMLRRAQWLNKLGAEKEWIQLHMNAVRQIDEAYPPGVRFGTQGYMLKFVAQDGASVGIHGYVCRGEDNPAVELSAHVFDAMEPMKLQNYKTFYRTRGFNDGL